ncbi:pseudouridylate synthase [Streptomyces venezuelae]|uniref:RNA pseudouridylate synthase n=4 Tax=Streptomyces venezuelae TaxID=54571 RepID=F2RE20_STRVP|nr:pseudouridine synthase [Streptomyces venezuelae]APE20643.1 pseudouridylate synthase [Streptomyces venezuelae]QER98032.1 pseudouridylate synthase [Streptomyces venezuelae ATCC 10712]QES05233.1 pseudouridylate synthase [Streptomyces venezuelae]QES17599.1 pseudouridylate synthase [Streptomyces venezuelae]CCA54560.1 Ribosomal large subunit pseudouridine synthase A [Streptomyces venezuelae ATCC 10712]
MGRRSKAPASPLPQRDGIDPVRVRLPEDPGGVWGTVRDHLLDRYGAAVGAGRIEEMLLSGRFVGTEGPVDGAEPYAVGRYLWFHRDFPAETPVPFPIGVVHRDERIVVADKPHFLATMPRGRHVTETALARLRRELGLPYLQPAHRLDRLTAGLVLCVVRPEDRGAYQTLFRDRRVRKEYEAVAPYDPAVGLPVTVRSRIEKERGVMAARELPGEPNAESRIELVGRAGGLGRYRLVPETGRTHQLRVHMNGLGLPILHDPIYPVVRADGPEDFGRPLQLLARTLEFTDPFTGVPRRFESRLALSGLA